MLKMRLQRVGRKHEPTFRLVLTDSKNSTKSGRFQEILGAYDPRRAIDSFKSERIKELVKQGVGLTASVNNLLLKHGIIRGKKVHVSIVPPPAPVAESPVEETTPAAESPTLEAPTEAVPESASEPTQEPEEKKGEATPQEPAPEV